MDGRPADPSSTLRPRRPRDAGLSDRILASARELIAELGVRETTITAIAERAGCSRPSVYARWPDVSAVITAAVQDIIPTDELKERFFAAVAAFDALSLVPDGRVLIEVLLLPSAVAHLRDSAGTAGA